MEASVNEPDTDGWTQLLDAVSTRDSSAPERVRSLVTKGAAITTGDRWSRTPVYWAAKTQSKWSLEILTILAESTRKRPRWDRRTSPRRPLHCTVLELVNDGDRFGISPLHVAARNKHKSAPDLVLWLVQRGARVTTRDQWGRTPLHCAADNQSKVALEITAILLDRGARLQDKDREGLTPIDYASLNPSKYGKELVLVLSDHHPVSTSP